MLNKKLLAIALGVVLLVTVFFGTAAYVYRGERSDVSRGSGLSRYNDNKNGISFLYPGELKIQEGFGGTGVSFWKEVKAEHSCPKNSKCLDGGLMFAFDYKTEGGDNNLEEAYKRSSFYKDNAKNFVDKTVVNVAGEQALLARFCDEWKARGDCDGGKRSVRELTVMHNGKFHIFRFGGVGKPYEKGVLESVLFASVIK